MSWEIVKLSDLLDFHSNQRIPLSGVERETRQGKYRYYGAQGVIDYIDAYIFDGEYILIAEDGANLTTRKEPIAFLVDGQFWVNNHAHVVRAKPDKSVNFFIVALLNHMSVAGYITGAAQPKLSQGNLRQIEVKIPSLPVQQKISGILSAYDDLIDNNRKRIALLEKAARLLYEEWFVRLQFPGHEHTPVVAGVPQGWDNNTIRSCSSYVSRGISPAYDDESEGLVVNQKCVRNNQLDLSLARNQKKPFKEEKQLVKGDVLINSTGTGTLGRVAQLWRTVPNCTVDSHVTIVRPRSGISACWLGYQLSVLEPVLENMGEGSTNQKELGRDRIADLKVLVPSATIQVAFDAIVSPIKDQMLVLSAQNTRLQAARDLLLPRLMSGELAV